MGNWKTREQERARSAADGERGGACGFHFRYETISAADGKRNSELRLARFVARLIAFKAEYFNTVYNKNTEMALSRCSRQVEVGRVRNCRSQLHGTLTPKIEGRRYTYSVDRYWGSHVHTEPRNHHHHATAL